MRSLPARIAVAAAGATAALTIGVAVLGFVQPMSEPVAVGSAETSAGSAVAAGSARTTLPTEVDYCYMDAMIPHHEQARELSTLVLRADEVSERVRALADFIRTDQTTEIAQMRQWQDAWAKARADAGSAATIDHSGHGVATAPDADITTGCSDHESHAGMQGMATPEQIAALGEAEGAAAQELFLNLMIAHHEGALEMAEQAVREGENAFVRSSAKHVLVEQEREIGAMRDILTGMP